MQRRSARPGPDFPLARNVVLSRLDATSEGIMRRLALATCAFLAGCQTQGGQVITALSSAQQIVSSLCNEGNAIQAAAQSPAGLAAAAQAGVSAGKVLGKVARANTIFQTYCTLEALAAPIAADAANQVATASAGILGTGAAPPPVVAAVKAGGQILPTKKGA